MNSFRIAVVLVVVNFMTMVASAQTCKFVESGTTMTLQNDCVASRPITIPDGFTLNGNNHLIMVNDSGGGLFSDGVVTNGGPVASVKNVTIQTNPAGSCGSNISNAIWFTSTSGSITGTTIIDSGFWNCAGPNNSGITLVSPVNVTVSGNHIYNTNGPALSVTCVGWPNCHGGTVKITGNEFSQYNCCSVVVFLSGVGGSFTYNTMSAWFVYQTAIQMNNTSAGFMVAFNNINLANGAAGKYGIYVDSDGAEITGNRIFNSGANEGSAIGIYNLGATDPTTNKITGNEIRCYGTPVYKVSGQNTFLTCPWK